MDSRPGADAVFVSFWDLMSHFFTVQVSYHHCLQLNVSKLFLQLSMAFLVQNVKIFHSTQKHNMVRFFSTVLPSQCEILFQLIFCCDKIPRQQTKKQTTK